MRPDASKGQWELSYYTCVLRFVAGKGHIFEKEKVRSNLAMFKKIGIHWIGLDGVNLLEPMEFDLQEAVHLLKGWFKEFGLKVSSLHYGGPTFASLSTGQDVVRENMVKHVEIFKLWEPGALVIHPVWIMGENNNSGIVQKYDLEVAEHGEKKIFKVIEENLKIMGKQAAKYGIKLAIENLGKAETEHLPLLVKAIDEPNVGYCIDSGHAHCSGLAVPNLIRQAGSRLFETHFHDNRGPDYAGRFWNHQLAGCNHCFKRG
jgi:sugar phosphate isomerase/epimerase